MIHPELVVKYDALGSEAHIGFDGDGDFCISETDYTLTIPLSDEDLDQLIFLIKLEKQTRRKVAQTLELFNDPRMYDCDLFTFGGVQ